MGRVFGGASVFVLWAVLLLPISTSAATTTVAGQEITITAAILPSRFVIIDSTGTIQQIISNNSIKEMEPVVYVDKVMPQNKVETSQLIRDRTIKLLTGKTIKPGILYDRKDALLTVEKVDFIHLVMSTDKLSQTNTHRIKLQP